MIVRLPVRAEPIQHMEYPSDSRGRPNPNAEQIVRQRWILVDANGNKLPYGIFIDPGKAEAFATEEGLAFQTTIPEESHVPSN